jgi:hypothetical protein
MGWNYTALDIATRNNHTESFNFLKMLVQNKNKHGSSKIRVAYIKIKLDSIKFTLSCFLLLVLQYLATLVYFLRVFTICFFPILSYSLFLYIFIHTSLLQCIHGWNNTTVPFRYTIWIRKIFFVQCKITNSFHFQCCIRTQNKQRMYSS